MKLELNHQEIDIAISNYVATMGLDTSGKVVTVAFTAGRKNGNTAEITIEDPAVANAEAVDLSKPTPRGDDKKAKAKDEIDLSSKEDDEDSLFAA